MKKSTFVIYMLLALTALACGFNFSTANIGEVYLAKDAEGNEPTTTFAQDDTLYAVLELANAPDDTTVKAIWTAVEADEVEPNFVLDETEYTGNDISHFSLTNDQLWPVGKYKVDIYLNGELDRTVTFEVEGDTLAQEATAVLESEPTATPEPTEAPKNTAGDSLAGGADAGDSLGGDLAEGVIFAESFDSDVNGWATGEFEDEYSTNEIFIEDGQYTLNITAIETAYVEETLPDQEFSDFILTLEATPRDVEPHYSFGIVFRLDADGHGYLFEVGNDGLYSVSLFDGEWQTLQDWTETDAIKPGQTNELTVVAEGSMLAFFVNGQALTTVEDDTVSEGQVGVVVEIFEDGKSATVAFDNLVVRESGSIERSPSEASSDVAELTFQEEPYAHPSDAFTFAVPQGWEIFNEDETSVVIGGEESLVGVTFFDAGFVYSSVGFLDLIDEFSANFISEFADSHEVVTQEGDPNDRVYLSTTYQSADGEGQIEFLFLQRKTAVFILYFVTTASDETLPVWEKIVDSYTFDPDAAIAAAPAPTPAPPPTQPPPPPGPSAPAGKGVMLFRNNTGVDFVIDVIGPTNTSEVIPPQSSQEFVLDPGQYTINGHSPGGQYAINAYSFDLAVGQVFPIDLN